MTAKDKKQTHLANWSPPGEGGETSHTWDCESC